MSLYLLKACVYVLAFYVPFAVIFKHITFFNLNRAYLLAGLLLSFSLPLYTGLSTFSSYTPTALPFWEPLTTQTELAISKAKESTGSLNMNIIPVILYVVGVSIRFVMLLVSITGTLKLRDQAEVSTFQNTKVLRTNTRVPFSFFNCVFLPKSLYHPDILKHEVAHVRQYHWLDLLLLEFATILLWFNPIMFAYKRSLKEQHEYLADQAAIDSGIDIGEYLKSMRQQIELAITTPLTSEFYFQSIKNRINMLTKKRTSLYGVGVYALVLPIVVSTMMAFSSKKSFQNIGQSEVDSIQDRISLCLPLDQENISRLGEGYGERQHPVLKKRQLHTGVDFFAGEGIPVVSTEEGVIVKAQMDGAWGNIIVVQHDDRYSTSYSHLKAMTVKEGDKVLRGQQIGFVGHTGLSSENHLHFELHKNGTAMDPIKYLPAVK